MKLWEISGSMPRVQRARLRSITLAYAGLFLALVLWIVLGAVNVAYARRR